MIPREIVHSDPEPLRKLDPHIPRELEQLVQKALHKDPEQRLQTAEEFAAGLYVAAQELRRRAAASAAAEPVPAPRPLVEASIFETPAATPESVAVAETAPAAPPAEVAEPLVLVANETRVPVAEAPARERPQDQTGPPQPWTARSYSANAPLIRDTAFAMPLPAPAAHPPQGHPPSLQESASLPVQDGLADTVVLQRPHPAPDPVPPFHPPVPPPQAGRRAAAQPVALKVATAKPLTVSKRAVAVLVGLVLAIGIVGSMISRQKLRASQNKPPVPAAVAIRPAVKPVLPAPPSTPATAPQEAAAPKPGESGPNDLGNPEFAARQTLNGPVRSYWESGRYADALALVDKILDTQPENVQARAWKKKIRDAQAAEAALK